MLFGNALSRARDPNTQFWSTPEHWPEDCRDYIFAARAILLLGPQRFGENWSDAAPATKVISEVPEAYNIYTDPAEIARAVRFLEVAAGQSGTLNALLSSVPKFPTDDEWARASALATAAHRESWNKYVPFVQLAIELANAARDGKLVTALCHRLGGEMVEQSWSYWNYPNRWLRFELCRVPKEPHLMWCKESDQDFRWLYLKRETFVALLNGNSQSDSHAVPEVVAREAEQRRPKRRGAGRVPEYQWADFANALYRRHNEGALPTTVSGIASVMAEWCQETWGDEPSDSILRERIGGYLRGLLPAGN